MILDYNTADSIKKEIKKKISNTKDHICYGVETESQLMYARGRLSSLEELLQDINNLQKENENGTID
tara:strand:- start:1794 stop:1994 length:201 start_codon:yes stop_codon:yes gene_type:complete